MLLSLGTCLPSGLREHPPLRALPSALAGVVDGPDLAPFLARKKDAKMLPRAAQLALVAAGRAMRGFTGDPESLAVVVAVGREPPDEGDADAALCAMSDGRGLDLARLGAGRDLYPPLLPLRTLPNMVLAHVAIAHKARGENAVLAGGAEAGVAAWRLAGLLLRESRSRHVLVGAAASCVDVVSARDRTREHLAGAAAGDPLPPPGEGAVFALVDEPVELPPVDVARAHAQHGDLGPVTPLLGLLSLARG